MWYSIHTECKYVNQGGSKDQKKPWYVKTLKDISSDWNKKFEQYVLMYLFCEQFKYKAELPLEGIFFAHNFLP